MPLSLFITFFRRLPLIFARRARAAAYVIIVDICAARGVMIYARRDAGFHSVDMSRYDIRGAARHTARHLRHADYTAYAATPLPRTCHAAFATAPLRALLSPFAL